MKPTARPAVLPPANLSILPKPPVPADLDMRHFDCMHLDTQRLLGADLWQACTGDEIAIALRLWAESWRQVPTGSLPNDDRKLALLAGLIDRRKRWNSVRNGALRGYRLCSDGRLYHLVVAEMALKAYAKSRAGKRGAKARWSDDKVNENNETPHATANGKAHGTIDDTLYSNGDGRPHGRTDAEKGREYPSYSPSLPSAGSVEADRPSTDTRPLNSRAAGTNPRALGTNPRATEPRSPPPKPASTEDHGVEDVHGRVCVHYPHPVADGNPDRLLWIDTSGTTDEVTLKRDLPAIAFTKVEALALRECALHPKPPAPA